jgi:hypothetical protein
MKLNIICLSCVTLVAMAVPALAGAPVPLPLAGSLGPVGIVGAAVVYGGYLAVKRMRNRG